jgi:hypothetical protein
MTIDQIGIIYSAILSTLSSAYLIYNWIQSRKIIKIEFGENLDKIYITNLSPLPIIITDYGIKIGKNFYKLSRDGLKTKISAKENKSIRISDDLKRLFQKNSKISFPFKFKIHLCILGKSKKYYSKKDRLKLSPQVPKVKLL